MKRFMYLSVGMLCLSLTALTTPLHATELSKHAQGIEGGVNYSGFASGMSDRWLFPDNIWGATAGLYIRFRLHKYLSLQLEPTYSQKGGGHEGNGQTQRLNYIELPVQALATLPLHERLFATMGGGAYIAYLVDAPWTPSEPFGGRTEYDMSDSFKSYDVGGILSLGMLVPLNRAEIFFSARWGISFIHITNEDFDWVGNKGRNSVLSLLVGIGFYSPG